MFNGLQGCTTGAGNLVLGVEGVKVLCELADKSIHCNVAKKCHMGKFGKLDCVPCHFIMIGNWGGCGFEGVMCLAIWGGCTRLS